MFADHSVPAPAGLPDAQLRAFETRVLGPEHAAEHAELRRLEAREAAPAPPSATALPTPPPPQVGGRWKPAFNIPVIGINAILLPTGKVLWFAYPVSFEEPGAENTAEAWLWNPATGKFKHVDPPIDPATGKPANIWCAGQNLTPDGRVVVVGGNLAYAQGNVNFKGLNQIYTFNPWNETWRRQPDMDQGRWYPSTLGMPDGRTLIMSGLDETGFGSNKEIELFTPSPDLDGTGTLTHVVDRMGDTEQPFNPAYPPNGGLYPHLFWMPNGKALVAGPETYDSWLLNNPGPNGEYNGWANFSALSRERTWGSGVLLPGTSKVQLLGGSDPVLNPMTGKANGPATSTTEVFDASGSLSAPWQAGPPMNVARSHLNTVLLPDSSLVTIGGGIGTVENDQWAVTADGLERQVELLKPGAANWTLGPAQAEARAYHSTALLLPDGRVVSAGDDSNGPGGPETGTSSDTAEIYEPPYLFAPNGSLAPRPRITSAPRQVGFGQAFGVATPDTVTKAALVAPGATTHANDMHQRVVPLTPADAAGGVSLTAPANGNIAPPGWYMLFVLNADGVPSVARWVLLGGPPLGRVDLRPRTEGGEAASFAFTGAPLETATVTAGSTLSVPLPGGPSTTAVGGRFIFQQAAKAGYDVVSVDCDDADSVTNVAARLAGIQLSAGEVVRCTFTNRKRPVAQAKPQPKPTTPAKPKPTADEKGPRIVFSRRSGLDAEDGVLKGRVADKSGVKRLDAALAVRRRPGCRWWSRRRGRLAVRFRTCRRPAWIRARVRRRKGRLVWTVRLRGEVEPGRYLVAMRARDKAGNLRTVSARKAPRVRVR